MSWIYALSYSVMLSLLNIDLSVSVTSKKCDYSSPSSPGISRSAGVNLINERYVINGRPPYSISLTAIHSLDLSIRDGICTRRK